MSNCTQTEKCKASIHWSSCPKAAGRHNDDATYNRSNLTIDQALALGWYEYLPKEKDSMG